MIQVLQNQEEVARSTAELRERGFRGHQDPVKNWDLVQVVQILEKIPKTSKVLDMGASGGAVLEYAWRAGFQNLVGIDINFTLRDRFQLSLSTLKNRLQPPYKLLKRDLLYTGFPDQSFDFIVCQSVIEHGVDERNFFRESARILKKGGKLFLSTDYWPEKIEIEAGLTPFYLPWRIFSKPEILNLLSLAKSYGFELKKEMALPEAKEKVASWQGKAYTFISFIFGKSS